MTIPFLYPARPHVRKHGPQGYNDYASYRDWLRDEFSFRCVYCLLRERWVPGGFHLDHFEPVAIVPHASTDYDNILYSCAACNTAKRDSIIPDPTQHLLSGTVTVLPNGVLEPKTEEADIIIDALRLNRLEQQSMRQLWLHIVRRSIRDSELLDEIFGFPFDLPDLSKLRPPNGNARPLGVEQSYFSQRERGLLPVRNY